MGEYFKSIKEKVLAKGDKVGEGMYRFEKCLYTITPGGVETILVPSLVHAIKINEEDIRLQDGDAVALKFLAESLSIS